MKKLLIVLTAVVMGFMSFSCVGRPGDDGRDGNDVYMRTNSVNVKSVDWEAIYDNSGLFLFYECYVNVPDLTRQVFYYGSVNVYTVVYTGSEDIQQPLPVIIPNEDQSGYWFKEVSYDMGVGSVVFYVHDSDFLGRNPGEMSFRIVMAW